MHCLSSTFVYAFGSTSIQYTEENWLVRHYYSCSNSIFKLKYRLSELVEHRGFLSCHGICAWVLEELQDLEFLQSRYSDVHSAIATQCSHCVTVFPPSRNCCYVSNSWQSILYRIYSNSLNSNSAIHSRMLTHKS